MSLANRKNDIINVSFFMNLISMIVFIFYHPLGLVLTISILNIILLGSHHILNKFGYIFDGLATTNKAAQGLNSVLGSLE